MATDLSKQDLFAYAIESLPEEIPLHNEETGIMESDVTIGGKVYHVNYLRNTSTGKWFVSKMTNSDGSSIA